jgi:hypothetical protein
MTYPFDYKKTWTNRATQTAACVLFEHPKYIHILNSTIELAAELYEIDVTNDLVARSQIAAHIQTGLLDFFEDQNYWKIDYIELADLFWGVFGKFGENGEIEGMIIIQEKSEL